jgi:hypothetical protein
VAAAIRGHLYAANKVYAVGGLKNSDLALPEGGEDEDDEDDGDEDEDEDDGDGGDGESEV